MLTLYDLFLFDFPLQQHMHTLTCQNFVIKIVGKTQKATFAYRKKRQTKRARTISPENSALLTGKRSPFFQVDKHQTKKKVFCSQGGRQTTLIELTHREEKSIFFVRFVIFLIAQENGRSLWLLFSVLWERSVCRGEGDNVGEKKLIKTRDN